MQPFVPRVTVSVPVTMESTRIGLGGGASVVITNPGDVAIWVQFGSGDAVAAGEGGGMPVSPESVACLGVPTGATHLALVADTNPGALVFVTIGDGVFLSARWGNDVELEGEP